MFSNGNGVSERVNEKRERNREIETKIGKPGFSCIPQLGTSNNQQCIMWFEIQLMGPFSLYP